MTQQYFFSVVDPDRAEYIGGLTAKNASELCNGVLGKLNTDGTVQVATAAVKAAGFVLDNRTLVYKPTDIYAAAGEYVTLVSGHVHALAGSQYFVGNTSTSVEHLEKPGAPADKSPSCLLVVNPLDWTTSRPS